MDRFERLPQEAHAAYLEGYLDSLHKVHELVQRRESAEHIQIALEQSVRTMINYTQSMHLPNDLTPYPSLKRLLEKH